MKTVNRSKKGQDFFSNIILASLLLLLSSNLIVTGIGSSSVSYALLSSIDSNGNMSIQQEVEGQARNIMGVDNNNSDDDNETILAPGSIGNVTRNNNNHILNQTRLQSLVDSGEISEEGRSFLQNTSVQIIQSNDTYYQISEVFPNNATVDLTLAILPEQKYTPSDEEMNRSSTTGEKIFNYTQTKEESADGTITFRQKFFIPYDALPPVFADSLQRSNSTSSLAPALYRPLSDPSRIVFSYASPLYDNSVIVPTSHGSGMLGVTFEIAEVMHGLFDIYEAVKWNKQITEWMKLLDAMEFEVQNCINNPSNPLITRESQESLCQKIREARTELSLNTGMRFAGTIGGLYLPFTFPALIWANHNFDDIDKQNIEFLQRNTIKCTDTPPIPPSYEPHEFKGTIEYIDDMHQGAEDACSTNPGQHCVLSVDEITRVQGEFTITLIMDRETTGKGSAHFQETLDVEYEPLNPPILPYVVDVHEKQSGDFPIYVTARKIGPEEASFELIVQEDLDWHQFFPQQHVSHWMRCEMDESCTAETYERPEADPGPGVFCPFYKVHPTVGGTYVYEGNEPAYCTLTLTAVQ